MDARDSRDGTQEDKEAHAAEEQEADEDLEDALRELEDARRDGEDRMKDAEMRQSAERGSENERTRARLEQDAYTPGFNPVADSNVHAEQEQAQKEREEKERSEREKKERCRKEEEEAERLRLAAVENRTYMIGRASVDILSDDLIAVRVLREHAVARDRAGRGETGDNKDSGEEGEHSETKEEGEEGDSGEEGMAGEYRDFEDPELVVVTEQAVCTTEQQARAFAFMQDIDTGRAVVFNRHASSFAGETLRRLVENEHTALRTVETVDRALYPYSFGRPSDKLIAALRVVVLLFAETEEVVGTDTDTGPETGREAGREADTGTSTETGGEAAPSTGPSTGQETRAPEVRARRRRLLTRESVTVVDKVVEREVQAESTEKEAKRERRNASFVDGPSHRREDTPLTPLRHVNRVQIAIDMTGEGDVRRKEEQFRTAALPQDGGRNDRGSERENENENESKGKGKDEDEKQEGRTEEEKAKSE